MNTTTYDPRPEPPVAPAPRRQPEGPAADLRIVVIASGAALDLQSDQDLVDNPIADYTVASRLFETTIVDPRTAIRSRWSRLADKVFGSAWVIAYRSVRDARKADAILAMGDDVGVPIAAMKMIMRSRTPTVMICHHLQSKRARVLFGRLRSQRAIQRFLPYSTALAAELRDRYGVPEEQIELLYNTIDADFFKASGATEKPHEIVSAGLTLRDYRTLLAATKGLDADVKIEAASLWYEQPVNFIRAEVHERAEICSLGTTAGLRDLYDTATVIVVPLRDIGHPAGNTTILEGMAMGKPVVATKITLGGDYIKDGETGFLVPTNDVAAMQARIVELLADAELRARIGAAGRRAVEEAYSRDQFAATVTAAVSAACRVGTGRPAAETTEHDQKAG